MNNGWLKNLLKKFKLNESTVSMILGALVIIVVGALIFNYFRGVGRPEEEVMPVQPEEVKPTTHKVAVGEHLWAIAEQYYGSGYNWVDIARENNLKNPDVLLSEQELIIPKAAVIEPTLASETVFDSTISGDQYTVAQGDHLWGIAVRAYGDGYKWVEIAHENDLANPNLIHPGNVLTLPR